jgi:tetratricopeptide (TPR) repeat protein
MNETPQSNEAVKVFYSYSHKDEELRNSLETHLALLKRRGVVSGWHDRRIGAGDEWAGQIDEHMERADIILLLVSADFLASDYCYDKELTLALQQHEAKTARVIPIILRPCDLTDAPFGKLQSLPKDRLPVTKWPDRDEAFTDIANGLRIVAEELKAKRRSASASLVPELVDAPTAVPLKSAANLIPRPPVVGFVARRDKEGHDIVGLLNEELSPDKNQLVGLWGPGGAGKTTLAAEVVRATGEIFTGRVVWASPLRRADFNSATLLDEIATQLGREDLRRLAPEPKVAQVAALVSEAPTLVILDNFETVAEEEQARCLDFLAQSAACPVLITTRAFIDRDDVTNVGLSAMEIDEAREFLRRLIARTPKSQRFVNLDHDDLIRKCEANPLLLQWVVRQIVLSKTPETALDYLSKGESDAAERVFARSFNLPQLGNDGRDALLALSLFTPSASREALAEVSGFDHDLRRLDKAVEALSSLWLVEATTDNERLFLRGLTRELAKSWLARTECAEEFQRLYVSYFLRYARARARETPEDLDALEAEKDNLFGALDVAFGARDWESVILIRGALDSFLYLHGYWDEAVRSGDLAETSASEVKNDSNVARFTTCAAEIRWRRGEHEEAKRSYREKLESCRKTGSDEKAAECLHQLAMIAKAQENLEEAHQLCSESLEIRERLGNQRDIALTVWGLGSIELDQGNINEAKRLLVRARETFAKLNDQSNIAGISHRLAKLAQSQGDWEEARRLYDESLVIKKKIGNQRGIALSLRGLGLLAEEQGDDREAARLLHEALVIFEKLGEQNAEKTRKDLARVKGSLG